MKKYQRVLRAREEVVRCKIEARRLLTHISDETDHFDRVLAANANSEIIGPLKDFVTRRQRVNMVLRMRIHQIHVLDGFSGIQERGQRVGTAEPASDITQDDGSMTPSEATSDRVPGNPPPLTESVMPRDAPQDKGADTSRLDEEDEEHWEDVEDDEYAEKLGGIISFMGDMALDK